MKEIPIPDPPQLGNAFEDLRPEASPKNAGRSSKAPKHPLSLKHGPNPPLPTSILSQDTEYVYESRGVMSKMMVLVAVVVGESCSEWLVCAVDERYVTLAWYVSNPCPLLHSS